MEKLRQKKNLKGGFLITLGYILSPFSWWNDLFVNIPLAYIFASIFGFFSKKLFPVFMILGYWLSNILGLILMHQGINHLIVKDSKKHPKNDLFKHLAISIIYTLIMTVLILTNILKLPSEYFK